MGTLISKINAGLSNKQRKMIVNEVGMKGQISGVTVYRYLAGARPQYLYQKLIAEVINENLNTNYTAEDLWDE